MRLGQDFGVAVFDFGVLCWAWVKTNVGLGIIELGLGVFVWLSIWATGVKSEWFAE